MSEPGYRPTADELLDHAEFIRFLARRLLRDDALADDAVQETFVRAIESPPRGPAKLRAWLARVVRNASLMRMRGEGRRTGRERAAARPERLSSPAEAAERIETQRRVIEAVQGLDEPYRSIVVHRFFEGLSVAEIAALEGSPEDTVRTRIRRALARLRKRLDSAHGGDRRAWTVALLPLAGLPRATGPATVGAGTGIGAVLGGGALMGGKKVALVAAVVALIAVATGVSGLFSGHGGIEPVPPAVAPPAGSPEEAAALTPSRSPDPSQGAIAGTVTRGGAPASARVEAHLQEEFDPNGMAPRYRTPFSLHTQVLEHPTPTGRPVASAEAESNGAFRVEGVGPGLYRVVARTAEGDTAAAFARVLCAGHEAGARLELPTGDESLSARAVWEDGTPFRGLVSAVPAGVENDSSPLSARTGPDGRFTLRRLATGTVDLTFVQKGGIRASVRGVRVPLGREAEFVVDYDLRPVTGRVTGPEGAPVSGATVWIWSRRRGDSRVLSRGVSDEEGVFRVLAAGESLLGGVRAPGFISQNVRFQAMQEVEVRLVPTPRLSGRVVRADDGGRVAGIPVFARTLADQGGQVHTVTDKEGRFELGDLPALEIMVFAHGGGLVSERLASVRAGGGNPLALTLEPGEERDVELRVVPAARATGRVLEATGEGIAGVVVHARIDLRFRTNWFPITSLGLARAATDEEGRFSIDTLLPGVPYKIEALPAHRIAKEAGPLTATAGAPLEVDLVLDPLRRLRVTVLDAETGDPVNGATVDCMVFNESGGGSGLERSWATGSSGNVLASPMPAGRLGVNVGHPEFASEYRYHDVPGSAGPESDLSVEIRLARGLEISGRILRPDGTPVTVGTVHPGLVGSPFGGVHPTYAGAPLGGDGSFVLRRLPAGSYRLSLRQPDGRIETLKKVVTAGSAGVELTVGGPRPPLTPLLRLLDATGKPVPGGEAWFRSVSGTHVVTGVGRVEGGLARPHQELREGAPRFIEIHPTSGRDGTRLGGTLAGPFAADLEEVEVRLAPAVAIEGVVTGPGGRSVRGVRLNVFIAPPGAWGDDLWEKPHATALSDEAGRFRLEGLSGIEWRIETKPPEGYSYAGAVTVRGGTTGIVIRLDAGVSPTVTVLDEEERPVGNALVGIHLVGDQSSGAVEHRSAEDGRVRFEGLDPNGVYRLEVRLFASVKHLFPETFEEWEPADTVIRLRGGRAIAGKVVDTRGEPALGAKVQVWPEDAEPGSWRDHEVDGDGRFEIGPIPSGPVRIRVRPAGGFAARTEWTRVAAGALDLALETELRHSLEVTIEGWKIGPARQARLLGDGEEYLVPEMDYRHQGPAARFLGLIPGRTYAFLCTSSDRKRRAWRRGIPADAGEITVSFRPTTTVSGRVIVPEGAKLFAVQVLWGGHHQFPGKAAADGSFRIENVPDDAFRLRAIGYLGNRRLEAEIDARPGDGYELRLEPRED